MFQENLGDAGSNQNKNSHLNGWPSILASVVVPERLERPTLRFVVLFCDPRSPSLTLAKRNVWMLSLDLHVWRFLARLDEVRFLESN